MSVFLGILWWICLLFIVSLFVRMILSYVSVMPGSPLETLNHLVVSVTDPVLGPVRRLIPLARMGGMAVDLSPLAVTVLILVVMHWL